jgi:C4-dicarboxylate-specific signal transduction histidine kinase
VSVHTIREVVTGTHAVLGTTLCPTGAATYLWEPGGALIRAGAGGGAPAEFTLSPVLARRIEDGELLARYEWDDGSGRPIPPVWHALDAELLVPIRRRGTPIGVLVLGRKGSGRPYTMHDVAFLRAAASQIALAMANAGAFARLESLNASLEQQVRERTASLEKANADLGDSLTELRTAYGQLERKQAGLMRAERLATLGRLTAGIAHEVNTPLGAVISSLKILTDLGREYAESIDDPAVVAADHREIASELVRTAEAAVGWARKAASFVGKVRIQGREPRAAATGTFEVATVVADVEALLQHRLRASTCRFHFREDSRLTLVGDPGQLGQVLINLVTNAMDAYEDAGISDRRIEVRASERDGHAVLTVRDWAGGIPDAALPKIFDELFTTKDATRGTGLGLSIARHLVEQSFEGTLTVETAAGVGSCFTISVPTARDDARISAAAG